jgi:hypothetical protein
MLNKQLKKIIEDMVMFISAEQQPHGNFLSISSDNPNTFTPGVVRHTTFTTSLILSCLASLPSTISTDQIKQKGVQFLLSQKSSYWSFNYWQDGSEESTTIPCPNDLDDTFAALIALYKTDKNSINGSALASIVELLIQTEIKEGGPYNTWLMPPENKLWRDIDPVVNSNIFYFLSLKGISLPSLTTYIENIIKKKKFTSKYYTAYPIIYFLSRTCTRKYREKLITYLFSKKKPDGSWGNILYTSLAVTSLLRLGIALPKVTNSIKYLLKNAGNTRKPYPFYIETIHHGKNQYNGSPALTAAFYTEALSLFLQEQDMGNKETEQHAQKQQDVIVENKIIRKIKKKFDNFPLDIKKQADAILSSILSKDKNRQITLLPYFFNHSLTPKHKNKKIKSSIIVDLGVANTCGWVAYKIYDDFLDNEGNPELLSIANICLRETIGMYKDILKPKDFALFTTIMDNLDSANTWERINCFLNTQKSYTLPNYTKYKTILAQKSLGHALGPLTVMILHGSNVTSPEIKNITSFFTHYIIARQLNDDAHDWEEDLKRGFINAASTLLLHHWATYSNNKKYYPLISFTDIKKHKHRLQELFWHETITEISSDILTHTKKARGLLKKSHTLNDTWYFEQMLAPLEQAAKKAVTERDEMLKFLKKYKG